VKWRAVIVREITAVGLVTLYFFFCFGIILTLKKLFLADHNIEFYALSTTVISALVAAKIVVVLDHTRAGTRFDATHTLIAAVAYKTLIYSVIAFAVLLGERFVHAYRESGGLGEAIAHLWADQDRDVVLAKVICVGLTFAGYHLYAGVDRRLGEGTLRRILASRPPAGNAVHEQNLRHVDAR